MKKRIMNIVLAIYLIVILLIQLSTISLAASAYIPDPSSGGAGSSIAKAGGDVLSIILAIGASVAAVILVWLAIKYITAAPDEKANIKKSAVTYIIGCVILFGFTGVLHFVVSISGSIGGSLGGGGGTVDAVSGADGGAQ